MQAGSGISLFARIKGPRVPVFGKRTKSNASPRHHAAQHGIVSRRFRKMRFGFPKTIHPIAKHTRCACAFAFLWDWPHIWNPNSIFLDRQLECLSACLLSACHLACLLACLRPWLCMLALAVPGEEGDMARRKAFEALAVESARPPWPAQSAVVTKNFCMHSTTKLF